MSENVKMDMRSRIDSDFSYHQLGKNGMEAVNLLRMEAKKLALAIESLVPSGREQASALTRLEESLFHANAGIARHSPVELKGASNE